MYATCYPHPDRPHETYVEVFDSKEDAKLDKIKCWGGYNTMTATPYVVFCPPQGIPRFSVKQEQFFKTFLLAAHIYFCYTGDTEYNPDKSYDAYKVVFPKEFYPFGTEQVLPKFQTC